MSRLWDRSTYKFIVYPVEDLRQEIAALAGVFSWQVDVLLDMEHEERTEWVKQAVWWLQMQEERLAALWGW